MGKLKFNQYTPPPQSLCKSSVGWVVFAQGEITSYYRSIETLVVCSSSVYWHDTGQEAWSPMWSAVTDIRDCHHRNRTQMTLLVRYEVMRYEILTQEQRGVIHSFRSHVRQRASGGFRRQNEVKQNNIKSVSILAKWQEGILGGGNRIQPFRYIGIVLAALILY